MPPPGPARRYRSWFINILLTATVVLGIQWWQARPLASGPAPALAARLLDGRPFALERLREDGQARPVLVHFWATWCPVCRLGQDTIDAIARDNPVVTVAVQSGDAQELRAHLSGQSLSFPVLPDPEGVLSDAWGVPAVPASFVVDRTGRIRFATTGHTTEAGLRARLWVAEHID